MNSNMYTGRVTSEVNVWGLPGKERVDFWFTETTGHHPLKLGVRTKVPRAVAAAQELADGDVIAMAGFLRSRYCRCEQGHYQYWLEAHVIERLSGGGGSEGGPE